MRGAHDLATSDFAVGPGGAGLGIDGVANDGICVTTKAGCAGGTTFFAVGAAGSAPGGSAVVVYDPVYDISVAVLARSGTVDVEDLAPAADLLTKVGKAVYDKTVGFTPPHDVDDGRLIRASSRARRCYRYRRKHDAHRRRACDRTGGKPDG